MAEDETTFLCGFQRARRYGSTGTPQQTRPRYTSVIRHQVLPTDTLQGLALKYSSSMMEIKRANKLWSNESLYLKDFLLIPVLDSPTAASTSSNGGAVNGGSSPSPTGSMRSQSAETAAPPAESMSDLFSRIDRAIKTTANNVRRLERESTLDKVEERDGDGDFVSSSQSEQSLRHFSFKSSPSPPQVEMRRIRNSLEKLQRTHDQFYQL